MEILVAYDVETTDKDGQRRLRKVAQVCQAYGQRVQNSVFECKVNEVQFEQIKHRLQRIINGDTDSLRIYRLRDPIEAHVDIYGKRPAYDLNGVMII